MNLALKTDLLTAMLETFPTLNTLLLIDASRKLIFSVSPLKDACLALLPLYSKETFFKGKFVRNAAFFPNFRCSLAYQPVRVIIMQVMWEILFARDVIQPVQVLLKVQAQDNMVYF